MGKSWCKVDRQGGHYRIREEVNEELVKKYKDGDSLRELEDYFNIRILEKEIEKSDLDLITQDAESIYRLLNNPEANPTAHDQIRNRLEQNGVDVDEFLSKTVSYQTIRSHLIECEDIDTSKTREVKISKERATIGALEARMEAVVSRAVERLAQAEKIDFGTPDVRISVNVTCEDCGYSYDVFDLFERGGCQCGSDD